MVNQINLNYGNSRSAIRELFEYGKRRKAEIGGENVFDFSLGNPSVPAPEEVRRALISIIEESDPVSLHGYTSAQGDVEVRETLARNLNARYGTALDKDCMYMTCGAAASVAITLGALLCAGDEVITFAPFFPEYRVFCEHAGGKLIAVPCKENFSPDAEKFAVALTAKTKAVIINSPNNPSGAVYTEEEIKAICAVLKDHKKRTGNTVYIISDEPYRELSYNGVKVPFVMNYYDDSVVCYSYSKSLSLPGERIGYIAVNNRAESFREVYAAVCGAGRAMGYVCAPALFQRLVARVDGMHADFSVYERNARTLYSELSSYGFEAVRPNGAFYLFVKAPDGDANGFSESAKGYELLVVSGKSFGADGYVRISYCVSEDTVARSLPAFKALAKSYNL